MNFSLTDNPNPLIDAVWPILESALREIVCWALEALSAATGAIFLNVALGRKRPRLLHLRQKIGRTDQAARPNHIPMQAPCIFVVAGPNGAGKSTAAPALLRDRFKIVTYVNADTIAAGLSAFAPEAAAFQAGRIMLQQLQFLRDRKETFAFETTLATRGYAQWLRQSRTAGYKIALLFLALPSPETAVERVARRVRSGGHDISEEVVRRRFERGLTNFFHLYQPLLDRWFFAHNGGPRPSLLAHGGIGRVTVEKSPVYQHLKEQYGPG